MLKSKAIFSWKALTQTKLLTGLALAAEISEWGDRVEVRRKKKEEWLQDLIKCEGKWRWALQRVEKHIKGKRTNDAAEYSVRSK